MHKNVCIHILIYNIHTNGHLRCSVKSMRATHIKCLSMLFSVHIDCNVCAMQMCEQ